MHFQLKIREIKWIIVAEDAKSSDSVWRQRQNVGIFRKFRYAKVSVFGYLNSYNNSLSGKLTVSY
jgi:hypothetical protein